MSYLFKSLAAGAAGALVVVFVKDAIIERKTLQRLKAELVLNETELRQLEKNIFDSKKTVLELEEEQRSAGEAQGAAPPN